MVLPIFQWLDRPFHPQLFLTSCDDSQYLIFTRPSHPSFPSVVINYLVPFPPLYTTVPILNTSLAVIRVV